MAELNAVMCVWNEADIIEASVRHAFAQGCRHVFLIDNGSTDDTVTRAQAAGAELALSFESKYFDEIQKIAFLNYVVKQYNREHSDRAIWWLYLDADEFPDTGKAITLFELVNSLDDKAMAVHGLLSNHFPSHLPYYVPGFHPADFMPLLSTTAGSKIPLVRYHSDMPHSYSCGGAHTLDTNGHGIPLVKNAITIHHFQLRRPEHTRARLKKLFAKRADGTRRVDWMDNHAGNWTRENKVQSAYHSRLQECMKAYKPDWPTLLTSSPDYNFVALKRWYAPDQLSLDNEKLDIRDKLLFQAVYQKFLGNTERALFIFNDLLPLCDSQLSVYVCANIAACLLANDTAEAQKVLLPLLKHNDAKLKSYAARLLASPNAEQNDNTGNESAYYKVETYQSSLDTATMQACSVLEQAIDNMRARNEKIQFL